MATITHRTLIGAPDAEPARYHRCPRCAWGTAHVDAAAQHQADGLCGLEGDDRLRAARTADLMAAGIQWGAS